MKTTTKRTADQVAQEARQQAETHMLEALQAYDRTVTRKLNEWGIADEGEE